MKHLLRAPEGCTAATVEGQPIEIVDGHCEVERHVKDALIDGHGFIEVSREEDVRMPRSDEERNAALKQAAINSLKGLTRADMLVIAQSYGISVPGNIGADRLRGILTDHINRQDEPGRKMVEAAREQIEDKPHEQPPEKTVVVDPLDELGPKVSEGGAQT